RHPHLDRWSWESAADTAIAATALARVGLADFAQRSVQTLSGGERQRLAIATLLVQQPDLYLLDEPLNHLDLNHAMATLALLRADGSWTCGAAAEVLNADSLQRLYGHPMRTLQDNGEPWFIPE